MSSRFLCVIVDEAKYSYLLLFVIWNSPFLVSNKVEKLDAPFTLNMTHHNHLLFLRLKLGLCTSDLNGKVFMVSFNGTVRGASLYYLLGDCMNLAARYFLACEQAHIWEHTREQQRVNSKGRRSGEEESGEEAQRKWACPDLCNFFISASPERSEIPLVEKRQRREACQSILFNNLPRVRQTTRRKKISRMRVCISDVLSKFQSVSRLNFELKKEQETAVYKSLLTGRDVLAVLPPGYGKSFIF